jgi:hypothetical protein
MGLIKTPSKSGHAPAHAEDRLRRAPARDYIASSGKAVLRRRCRSAGARAVDGQAAPRHDGHRRGRHRHGGGIPGTLVNLAAGGGERRRCASAIPPARCASARRPACLISGDGQWTVTKAIMSRSARVLMEGWVRVPVRQQQPHLVAVARSGVVVELHAAPHCIRRCKKPSSAVMIAIHPAGGLRHSSTDRAAPSAAPALPAPGRFRPRRVVAPAGSVATSVRPRCADRAAGCRAGWRGSG